MAKKHNTKKQQKPSVSSGITIRRETGDIIERALDNDFDGVDEILEADGRMVNAQYSDTGVSPLMATAGRGMKKMVAHLLSKDGIDLTLRDAEGKDAFDYAMFFPDVMELLMRKRLPNMKWSEPFIRPM